MCGLNHRDPAQYTTIVTPLIALITPTMDQSFLFIKMQR
ncbi:Uncharacterised protein [Vibrio cholerae]|nr:Uncharacterised protein [Vibrio cholerae]